MPVGGTQKTIRIPKSLTLGMEHQKAYNVREMEKALPYVDYDTGVRNRLITRDPITGLGDLPAEHNAMEGSRIKRHMSMSVTDGGQRDPILMTGNLGAEYNCLYTTKSLVTKSRDDRNIMTLEGNLGEELDPIRPHGGKPRHTLKQDVKRDPVSGSGDFGPHEWDPIWKYRGRLNIRRPEQIKRDPITHNVPLENMGERQPKNGMRQFSTKQPTDPITFENDEEIKRTGLKIRRHSVDTVGRNKVSILEHIDAAQIASGQYECPPSGLAKGKKKFTNDKGESDYNPLAHVDAEAAALNGQNGLPQEHSGLKKMSKEKANRNPITHTILDKGETIPDKTPDSTEITRKRKTFQSKRDPISGEGINKSEFAVLWIRPEGYTFREKFTPKASSGKNGSK